jgi:hypothetical protein
MRTEARAGTLADGAQVLAFRANFLCDANGNDRAWSAVLREWSASSV